MSASLEQLLRDARIDLVLARIEKDSAVINEIINNVDNEIRSVRFNSIFVLGELGEKSGELAVNKITKYLDDDDWSIRREVARSLGKIGKTAGISIPQLVKCCEDDEDSIRVAVVTSLGKMGSAKIESLGTLKTALNDRNEQVRIEAANALGLIGSEAYEIIPDLMKSMSDPSWAVRTSSARAMSGIGKGTIKAIPTLLDALDDKDWRVRYHIVNTLIEIGEESIPHLLKALNHKNSVVRREAVEALGELGIKTPEIVENLGLMLKDPKEDVRGKAATSLRTIGKEAVPALVDGYKKPIEYRIVDWLLPILFVFTPLFMIILLLIGGEAAFQLYGIFLVFFVIFGAIELYDQLNFLLGGNFYILLKSFNMNYKNKILIISAIGGIGEDAKEAIPFIVAKLNDGKKYIRVESARNLGSIGIDSVEALSGLEKALIDPKAIVRREAALSIGKIGSIAENAVPSLLRALDDKNPDVRWRASEALGKIKINTPEVISALKGLIHDECDYVCESADFAIDNITENI